MNVFDIVDKSGRKIRLPKKSWTHITTTHREMANYLEEIKETLIRPLKIIQHTKKENLCFRNTMYASFFQFG